MALDDLIRIGKQSSKAEKAKDDYGKDKSKNLTLELAKISGIANAGPAGQAMFDAIKRDSPNYVETRHGTEYGSFIGGQRDLSYAEVEADVVGSFAGLVDDRIASYLMTRAPVKYFDADQEILDIHAAAYEAAKLKKDEGAKKKRAKEEMKAIVANLKAKKINPAILKLGQSIAEATDFREIVGLIDANIDATVKAFGQIDPVKLRAYAQGRYVGIADQDARKAEAYELGKAIGEGYQ